MTTKLPVIYKKDSFITVILNNRPITIISSEPNFQDAVSAYRQSDWETLAEVVNRPKLIEKYSDGNIKVYDGVITFKGKQVHNYVVDKIFELLNDGFDINPIVKFLDSRMANPSPTIQEELFQFLEVNQMAITEDGGFLAYKLTKNDGTPYYQGGSMVYKVGETMEMKREDVCNDRSECGGPGLYFGNKGYWNNSFDANNRYAGDGKMFIVKLMPEWVVSIPSAESQTKGRAYKMEVVAEYESVRETVNRNKVVGIENYSDFDGIEDREFEDSEFVEGDLFTPKTPSIKPSVKTLRRAKNGRFVKKNAPVRDSKGRFQKKN